VEAGKNESEKQEEEPVKSAVDVRERNSSLVVDSSDLVNIADSGIERPLDETDDRSLEATANSASDDPDVF
jgi:hypothetical protein